MSAPAILAAGIGIGVLVVSPLIGIAAVIIADALCNRHWQRVGLGEWARTWGRAG